MARSREAFQIGESYPRDDLLAFCGSRQMQQGIIWGELEPACVIVTSGGKFKTKAGYHDERLADGSYCYFGQGSAGNQDPERKANRLLVEGNRTVLLFLTREPTASEVREQGGSHAKLYTFDGHYEVGAWDFFTPTAGPRAGDRLLRFHLVPATVMEHQRITATPESGDARVLREMIREAGTTPIKGELDRREYLHRSELVRQYALLVAGGNCELCGKKAPFVGVNGELFLEVHYLYRLSDGGPDAPENVAALCPNCHRAVHHSRDRAALASELEGRVRLREARLGLEHDGNAG